MSSPESELSDISSEADDHVKVEDASVSGDVDVAAGPRSKKRQRTGGSKPHTGPSWDSRREATPDALDELDTDVSDDSWGSVPASPTHATSGAGATASKEDEDGLQEQVSFCKWDGCTAGDLGDMDRLVQHLQEDHIGTRQKKYSCEWLDCSRKGSAHASGYALRAHMRSHTREKPFYCSLPECDRAFTRSDALAKHMRTVHETEALRPSDPVPKHHSAFPKNQFQRLRLVMKASSGGANGSGDGLKGGPESPLSGVSLNGSASGLLNEVVYTTDPNNPSQYAVSFPADVSFSDDERSMPANQLYELLRQQLIWAQEDAEEIKREAEALERQHRDAWASKELALENVKEAEAATLQRRAFGQKSSAQNDVLKAIMEESKIARELPLKKGAQLIPSSTDKPWWREPNETRTMAEAEDSGLGIQPLADA